MKDKPSSSRNESRAGNPAPARAGSTRRRFLKQTLAAGVAGAGVRGAHGQASSSRAKPHKSPPGKKDHKGKLPKPSSKLKESMEWDFERFVSEVIDQIIQGKTTKEIEAWIYTAGVPVDKRQIVETEVEDDASGGKQKHPLGVCMEAPIEWKMDGDEIAGFIIRGRLGRLLAAGEPLECDAYGPEEKAAAVRPSAAQALVFSGRIPQIHAGQRLVAGVGGPSSSSSSSSSSSWPKP